MGEEDLDGESKLPVAELQIPMGDDVSGDEMEDNELRTSRRERARDAALSKRKEEEDLLKADLGELPDEEEDESSYEDESDEDARGGVLLKPVFVSKAKRETVA